MIGWFHYDWLHPGFVHLEWVVVLLAAGLVALEQRSRAALGRFVSPVMQRRLVHGSSPRRRLGRIGLATLGLGLGVVALMRPQVHGERETAAIGRVSADLVVVLDVSKSMLAEDAAPNRLGRARAELDSLLEELPGDRVGLVAFAGRATILCPLTPDYSFFRMILDGTDPHSVSRGGTRIGDGIRKALSAFGPDSPAGAKLILLITDGEDHESRPLDAAKAAAEAGVRIVSIGFGSEQGSEITLTDPATGAKKVLTDRDGDVVKSRLDGELLRQIALATQGAYVPAGTAALDLDSIVKQHITPMVRAGAAAASREVPIDRYPWYILGALVALVAAARLGRAP